MILQEYLIIFSFDETIICTYGRKASYSVTQMEEVFNYQEGY